MFVGLGADVVVDYNSEDLYEVMEATSGAGCDLIYDPVGVLCAVTRLVAWEGRLLVVGFASGDIPSAPANRSGKELFSRGCSHGRIQGPHG